MKLTLKQENFCLAYIETGNATEAYRRAYNKRDIKTDTANRNAKKLMDNVKIMSRLEELRKPIIKRHNVTVDSLIGELEEARQLALETEQTSAAVGATMGKAKLCGLDKQVIDHTSSDGTMSPKQISEEELKAELDRLGFGKKSQLDEKVKQ